MTKNTSWGEVAEWYDELLEKDNNSFQNKVILPNLLRLLQIKSGLRILDIGAGQGFFARNFALNGAEVLASDISPELIEIGKKACLQLPKNIQNNIKFFVAPAHDLKQVKTNNVDVVTVILALQNMENLSEVFFECHRVLKPGGKLVLVLNHPTFRVPGASDWAWDETSATEYRRIGSYLSESKSKIDMHPGKKEKTYTISFHRPMQFYFKHLSKQKFVVTKMEEWISDRHPPKGRKYEALERARKEIPLFMYLEAIKL